MHINLKRAGGLLMAATSVTAAHATGVRVTMTGEVDYNVIGGAMAGTPSGTPVTMSFLLDSGVYTDSGNYPVRGYNIDVSSMTMQVGSVSVAINNPQTDTAYFVLRNNDPAVDGFYLSSGGVDWPAPLECTIPGLNPVHELNAEVGFSDSTHWNSLNILDAVGTYDQTNLSSYYWAIGRFGNPGAEYVYETVTIESVPEPATIAALGFGAAALIRRRRKG